MPSAFSALIDQLRPLLAEGAIAIDTTPDADDAAELWVRGERFLLLPEAGGGEGFMVYAEFGELPPDQTQACLQRILQINLAQAAEGRAGFGLAGEGEGAVLVYAMGASQAQATPSALLRAMQHLAEQIKAWRSDHFLGEPATLPDKAVALLRA